MDESTVSLLGPRQSAKSCKVVPCAPLFAFSVFDGLLCRCFPLPLWNVAAAERASRNTRCRNAVRISLLHRLLGIRIGATHDARGSRTKRHRACSAGRASRKNVRANPTPKMQNSKHARVGKKPIGRRSRSSKCCTDFRLSSAQRPSYSQTVVGTLSQKVKAEAEAVPTD